MKRLLIYTALALVACTLGGCKSWFEEKTNWAVTLDKEDKSPYGTYLAYESLPFYFPEADIISLSRWQRYNHLEDSAAANEDKRMLLICVGLDFLVTENEWKNLLHFAAAGNEVVVFCSVADQKILNTLNCIKVGGGEELPPFRDNRERRTADTLRIAANSSEYSFSGRAVNGYFIPHKPMKAQDSSLAELAKLRPDQLVVDTLGYVNNKANFIRYAIKQGHITLHAAPLAVSNYFLLQPGHKKYLDAIWQTLPNDISRLYWNDYYKRSPKAAGLDLLWNHPATRWALIIAIATLLLYVFFESKRRQRIIPVTEQPRNTSVSFVETVGRLYYNKGDHRNLADKMVQHFLEWVRLHYYLNTNEINEQFAQQLRNKSGQSDAVVHRMMDMIHEVRMQTAVVDETYLYDLYHTTQLFYNTKNN